MALKYCDQAHQKSLTNHGNLQYWLIIAHKADLLIELNRVHEAILCLEELHGSSLDEIKEARKLLSQKINSEKPMNIDSEKLHTTWKERLKGDLLRKELPTLGELEQKLIDFIAQGPKDKHEIILHLYEAKGDYYSLENRFKRLISRTRKKVPNLIVFKDGKYTLSDPVFQQKIGS